MRLQKMRPNAAPQQASGATERAKPQGSRASRWREDPEDATRHRATNPTAQSCGRMQHTTDMTLTIDGGLAPHLYIYNKSHRTMR